MPRGMNGRRITTKKNGNQTWKKTQDFQHADPEYTTFGEEKAKETTERNQRKEHF